MQFQPCSPNPWGQGAQNGLFHIHENFKNKSCSEPSKYVSVSCLTHHTPTPYDALNWPLVILNFKFVECLLRIFLDNNIRSLGTLGCSELGLNVILDYNKK